MKRVLEQKAQNTGQGGFTLVELLVVVAILGILAGVAVFAVGNLTNSAAINSCRVEASTLENAWSAAKASTTTTDTTGTYLEGASKYFTLTGGSGTTPPTVGRAATNTVAVGDCPNPSLT